MVRAVRPYKVREYSEDNITSFFRDWIDALDVQMKARIQARVLRFEQGNLGDYKSIGKGVYEVRFNFGPGYRLYFGFDGPALVLLLLGGDKSTQSSDIKKAHECWYQYLEAKNDGPKK